MQLSTFYRLHYNRICNAEHDAALTFGKDCSVELRRFPLTSLNVPNRPTCGVYYLPNALASPYIFTIYIRDMIRSVVDAGVGCVIGGHIINILQAYADDIVVVAPSWRAMQLLLSVLNAQSVMLDLSCNANKTVCMVFTPKSRNRIVRLPDIHVGGLIFYHGFFLSLSSFFLSSFFFSSATLRAR